MIKHVIENINIEEIVNKLIYSSDIRLRNDAKRTKLFMPKFLFEVFIRQLTENYKVLPEKGIASAPGVDVQYGYENKIIFVHEDYPQAQEPWMISTYNL